MKFIDPDGRFDVHVNGLDNERTLTQINSGVKGINVARDKDGKLSYTKTEGQKLNKGAKALIKAIDDHTVDVKVNTTGNATNSKGGVLIGGAFMGTKVSSDGKVTSTNEYDSPTGGRIDDAYNKPGGTILHEITEGYSASKTSQSTGQSSGPDGTPGSVYGAAHEAAGVRQPGQVDQTYYDGRGKVLPPETLPENITGGVVWRANGNLFIAS